MELKKKLIEMVCEGNSSRSELARLMGNKYLQERDLGNNYEITSSGIYVSMPSAERISKFSPKDISSMVRLGISEGFYDKINISKIKYALNNKNKETLLKYFFDVGIKFQELENFYREKARKELGITENFKESKEQTKVNPDNISVFTMDRNSRDFVKFLYGESNYNPIIDVLGEFASSELNPEITNNIIDNSYEKTYTEAVNKLKRYVPRAMELCTFDF